MNCELYQSEMYAWRPGCEVSDFKQLFGHLAACPACARRFAQLSELDQAVRQTFREVPEAPTLERRILSGLAHERLQAPRPQPPWKRWALFPIAAMLLLTLWLGVIPYAREAQLGRQITTLLRHPPAAGINSTDQSQLMAWSAVTLHGFTGLPPELRKVTFRSASALEVGRHQAVLLGMKNEQRASLLIVDGVLTHDRALRSFHGTEGSNSRWSDGRKTYVLLFKGDEQEMLAYMQQMGITA